MSRFRPEVYTNNKPAIQYYTEFAGCYSNTTAIAVYAPIEYSAEVKGACISITHDQSYNYLGLHGGKLHDSRDIARKSKTSQIILQNHENKLANTSKIYTRVDTPDWSTSVTTDEWKAILETFCEKCNNINDIYDLFKACIQLECKLIYIH